MVPEALQAKAPEQELARPKAVPVLPKDQALVVDQLTSTAKAVLLQAKAQGLDKALPVGPQAPLLQAPVQVAALLQLMARAVPAARVLVQALGQVVLARCHRHPHQRTSLLVTLPMTRATCTFARALVAKISNLLRTPQPLQTKD